MFDSRNRKKVLASGHVIGLRNELFTYDPQRNVGFIAVRFRAGAFANFCPVPLSELTNHFVDLYDLWGKEGSEMCDKIVSAASFNGRVAVLEEYLTKLLKKHERYDKRIQTALTLAAGRGSISTKESLAEYLNVSTRQLERCFKESIGVGPKLFQKIVRFDEVMRILALHKTSEYLPVALDAGYYDQSHFIKEFNSFIGESPLGFFKKNESMSHFYNID